MKLFWIFFALPYFVISQSTIDIAEDLLVQKQYEKTTILLNEYIKTNNSDLKAIELLGDAYGQQKKWDESIVNYKKLVGLSPKTANYHYKYGGALGMKALSVSKLKALGIIGDVEEAFLTAAQLDPKHIDTRWALVELYMQLPGIIGGSKKKALFYAEELQALSPVDGYLSKGYIYQCDKDFSNAETNYKKAVEVGGSKTCYLKLAMLYSDFNKKDKALEVLKEAYEIHKTDEFSQRIKTLED